jgi:hypothetical protein
MNNITEFLSKIDLVPQGDQINQVLSSKTMQLKNCFIPSCFKAKYFEKNMPIMVPANELFNYEKFCQTNIQLTIECSRKIKRKSNEKTCDLTKSSMN